MDIPPEILNIICKSLSWQNIKSLEEALGSDLINRSGVKLDTIKIIVPELRECMRTIQAETKHNKIELKDCIANYYFLIVMYEFFDMHTLQSLLNLQYEEIINYRNLIYANKSRLKKYKKEYNEIFVWFNSIYS